MVITGRSFPVYGFRHDIDQVVDVDEVTSGIGHEAALAVAETAEESRQRSAEIARAVRVGQPERQEFHAAERDELFTSRLGDRVAAAGRLDWVLQRDRLFERMEAVAECRLKIDQTAHAVLPGCSGDDRASKDIGRRVLRPVLRIFVRCRGVYDHVRFEGREAAFDEAAIRNSAFYDLETLLSAKIVAASGREVVDDHDLVTGREAPVGKSRPDESRSASDENFHVVPSTGGRWPPRSRSRTAASGGISRARARKCACRSWNSCCHSSSESNAQTLRPNFGS